MVCSRPRRLTREALTLERRDVVPLLLVFAIIIIIIIIIVRRLGDLEGPLCAIAGLGLPASGRTTFRQIL
jgi:hypothetical protein